jgi:hypothetical protein
VVNKDLIIDVGNSEVSLALLEDKQLIELNKEKRSVKFSVGDIYLGKVKKIMPGLNAAFVNVGYERDAFLHYLDLGAQFRTQQKFYTTSIQRQGRVIPVHKFNSEPDIDKDGKITDVLTTGQTVLVQITKEPISTKGPRLSSEISLAGRNLVLMPFSDKESEHLVPQPAICPPKPRGIQGYPPEEGKGVIAEDGRLLLPRIGQEDLLTILVEIQDFRRHRQMLDVVDPAK